MIVQLDAYRQLRVGGIDATAVARLSDEAVARWLSDTERTQRFLTDNREDISDRLHGAIARVDEDSADRPRLIAFRRSLYNGRWAAAVTRIDSLSRDAIDLVEEAAPRTLEALRVWSAAQERRVAEFSTWVDAERTNALELSTDPSFSRGISVAASSLVPALRRMREHADKGRHDKKDKKAYRSLVSYLLRAAAKTSPFSTLGPVCVVPSGQDLAGEAGDLTVGSRWSIYPVARILNALTQRPSELSRFTVNVSPYARETEDGTTIDRTRWHFREIESGNDYAQCDESRVRVGQKELTDTVARSLEQDRTLGELRDTLVEQTGMSPRHINTLFTTLLRLGFLQVDGLAIHPHVTEKLADTIERLRATDNGSKLADILVDLQSEASRFAEIDDIDERLSSLSTMRELVAKAYELAEIDAPVPRSVVYEDALMDPSAVRTEGITISEGDAVRLAKFLAVFDQANIKHDLMKGFFFQKVGKDNVATDVLSFISQFEEDLLDSFEGYDYSSLSEEELAVDPWLKWGQAWRWVSAQRMLGARLQEGVATYPVGSPVPTPGTLSVDKVVDGLGDLGGRPSYQHLNVLCQTDGQTTVVNDSFGGVGFPVSRFSHLLDTDGQRYTDDTEQIAARANVRIAEVTGGAVFTNLNVHVPVMRTELVVDGDPVGSKSPQALSIHDLQVRYSPQEDRLQLIHGQTGQQIHPHYPGYLIAGAIPRHHQSLLLFTPSTSYTRRPADLMSARPEPGSITTLARVTLGGLVISRAQYRVALADLPDASPMTADGYQQWVDFWLEHALPKRLFAKVAGDVNQRHKPALIDVGIIGSIEVLHNTLRAAPGEAYVIFTECLPDAGDSPVHVNGSPRVAESMIGINLVRDTQ